MRFRRRRGRSSRWHDVAARADIRALDRTGKGIRGAPRDAMLAQLCRRLVTRARVRLPSRDGPHRRDRRAVDRDSVPVLLARAVPSAVCADRDPGRIAVAMLFLVHEPSQSNAREARHVRARAPASPATRVAVSSAAPEASLAVLGVISRVQPGQFRRRVPAAAADRRARARRRFVPLLWARCTWSRRRSRRGAARSPIASDANA